MTALHVRRWSAHPQPGGTGRPAWSGRGSARRRTAALLAAVTLAGLAPLSRPSPADAAAGDIGMEGPAYVEAGNPTVSKPESKLWFQDGSWYAAMLKTGTPSASGRPNADLYVHRLVGTTWQPTSTLLDDRGTTKVDVVSSGNTLYVASHKFVSTATGVAQTVASNQTRITRFTYDPGTHSYTKVAGFPKVLNPYQMESLSIDVDSTGAVWAAWVQANHVYWQRSTNGGATWSAPAALSDPRAVTSSDDVASVVAFGSSVGIMWADQTPGNDGFWFSAAAAGSGPVSWSAAEAAYTGPGAGDDHVNLKSLDDHVYAAVKTRTDTGTHPLIVVLDRAPGGTWTRHTAYVGRTNTTRPILELDATHRTAELFAVGPEAAGGNGELGDVVYRKSAPLATLAFGDGLGQAVMARPGSGRINDPTGTKQPVTTATGLAVLAADASTQHYWHHAESLVRTAPSAPAGVTARPGVGKVVLRWAAATAGDVPIDHYRVTATPALAAPLPDYPASATGTDQQIAVPNDVTRTFHVQAVAGGQVGPAADSEAVTPGAYIPFLSPESFADQQARDFLHRYATPAEKAAARRALVGGGASAADVVLGSAFYANPSVAGDGSGPEARVARLYFAYFRRSPDRSGFDYWLRQVSRQSLERISAKFAASPEFVRTYGALSDDAFVRLVYRNLFDRAPDAGGRAYWLRRLDDGLGRGSMMTKFSESSEYRRRSQPSVSTAILYRHLLQRMPTAPELAAQVAKGSAATVVTDVIASSEYQDRIVR